MAANDAMEVLTLEELERRYIERVLALFEGNKSRAAQVLGIDGGRLPEGREMGPDDHRVTHSGKSTQLRR